MEQQALETLCKRFVTPHGACALFKDLREDALGFILRHAVIKNEPEGKTIVRQGEFPQFLYLILSGAVQTVRTTADGKETPVRLMAADETFMDDVIFMDSPSPISARTAEPSTILLIPAAMVRKMVTQNGNFAFNMLQITAGFYKKAIHQIENVTAKSPVQRVGYYLLNAYLEQGNPQATTLRLPHKKSAIASHLGMQPETLSRALAQIKKMGVDIDRETIELKDVYALCLFCDTDAAGQCKKLGTPGCTIDEGTCEKLSTFGKQ
jgi:CRP-like cAMP-binding protein